MRKTNQKGFTAVEALIIVLVLLLLGGGAWYLYNKNQEAKKSTSASNAKQSSQKSSETVSDDGYLVIKEWGVKIKMQDADKVGYTYDSMSASDPRGSGTYQSGIGLVVKPQYLQDKTCVVSVGITRYTADNIKTEFVDSAKKIGDYYYLGGGSPYNCGNEQDDALNNKVRADFNTKNLEVL